MQAVTFPARQTRARYRHELGTLTYVTIDQANGGIIRNLNEAGVAVQAVAAPHPQQRLRLRFELRSPRVRVEAHGEVSWANHAGQCGIRFVDLPARTRDQINQWIFSNLLESAARAEGHPRSMFGSSVVSIVREKVGGEVREEVREEAREENELQPQQNDGLTLSGAPRTPIRLQPDFVGEVLRSHEQQELAGPVDHARAQPSWLSRPLSDRSLRWLVDGLVVTAALLLFALIFLSITHELPRWPLTLGAAAAAMAFIAATYRIIFAVLGGSSVGARLAQATSQVEEENVEAENEEEENAGRRLEGSAGAQRELRER